MLQQTSISGPLPINHLLRDTMKKAFSLLIAALAALPFAAQAQDAKAGQTKAAMCIGCHGIPGYQASFPEIHKVPKIAGQNAEYLKAALDAYRKGDRKHPTMRGMAASLSDADIADLAAYYATLGQTAGAKVPAEAPAAPAAVADRLKVCVGCHGPNFSDTTAPANPRLAGQHADYLLVALRAYTTDGNALVGRGNATMRGMLAQEVDGKNKLTFTDAELKQVANYLASLPGELKTVPQTKMR
jgi:cytochrome c553